MPEFSSLCPFWTYGSSTLGTSKIGSRGTNHFRKHQEPYWDSDDNFAPWSSRYASTDGIYVCHDYIRSQLPQEAYAISNCQPDGLLRT